MRTAVVSSSEGTKVLEVEVAEEVAVVFEEEGKVAITSSPDE